MTTTTERTGHSKGCERAERPPCACRCGGAEHGWQGALAIATASSDGELRRLEREADQAWKQAEGGTGKGKPGPQTADGRQAAIKTFTAEVIRWLRRDRNLCEATKQLGEPFRISHDTYPDAPREGHSSEKQKNLFVDTHVIPGLREEFGDQRIDDFQKKARNAHFWCELLAQTAHALDEFRGQYDRAKKAVVTVLTSYGEQRPDGWISLLREQDVIERAVELVFKYLPRLATGGVAVEGAFSLIWPARVLAVLMCREPRRHPAVREYCIGPIVQYGRARIREWVKDRLRRAFPCDWPEPPAPDEDT